MTKTEAITQIEKEFAAAKYAQGAGNDGMVRVCARRAAGIAIGFWLEKVPRHEWRSDALGRLKNVHLDESMPKEIRDAASRLTVKITKQFTSPFPTDPIDDSKTIIAYLLQS